MADRYVYSGAAGTGSGADWANAHTNLGAAITAGAAGDTYYVAHDHSHNYGVSTTLTFKGTTATPDRVLCVNRAGSVPPVAADLTTGATEGTNAATTNLIVAGFAKVEGVTLAPGSGQSTTCSLTVMSGSGQQSFKDCLFSLLSSGGSSRIGLSGSNGNNQGIYDNCKVKFASTAQRLEFSGGEQNWRGPAASSILAAGSLIPTSLLTPGNNGKLTIDGADLSEISGTLVVANLIHWPLRIINCKLHASATIAGTPTSSQAGGVDLIGCHSSGNVQRNERYRYQGTLTTETTIVRTGGASDGTTPYSWKIVPTGNNERDFPFETFEGAVWNDAIGSAKTLTVHCVTDNVTLTDAEIWLEVEYLGSSGSPISSLVSDAPATVLTAAANQATSTETWTTTGLTTPVKQKLECTFTPQLKGYVRWRVKYAKTSTTVYVCPEAELS